MTMHTDRAKLIRLFRDAYLSEYHHDEITDEVRYAAVAAAVHIVDTYYTATVGSVNDAGLQLLQADGPAGLLEDT